MGLLTWGFTALIVSMVAGTLSFTGVARSAATAARALFGIFLAIALVLLVLVVLGVGAVV